MTEMLGSHLKRAEQSLAGRKAAALRPLNLTVAQYSVLSFLLESTQMTCARLARKAGVRTPTMNGILGNLYEKGLLSRRPSPDHARVALISLTDDGLDLAEHARTLIDGIEHEVFGEFSEREQATLARLLDRISQAAASSPASPAPTSRGQSRSAAK